MLFEVKINSYYNETEECIAWLYNINNNENDSS